MERILQDFSGVEQTSVEYSTWTADDDIATEGVNNKSVCSDNGTTVTVTFAAASLEVGTRM